MAPAERWQLRCERLAVRRGRKLVLRDVSLALGAGDCLCVLGPNGSGKSTLLLTLLGLLKPEGGAVLLDGRPIQQLSPRQRGRFAAYVPQSIERLPAYTVYDVVAGGRFPHAPPLRALSQADEEIVEQTLERCGLAELADRALTDLSGGERQKALLAAALAQDAQLLVLDEPTSALDPAYQIELLALLADWRARGRALLLVTHDINLPRVLRSRVLALSAGEIALDGAADDVLTAEALEAIYGAPFELSRSARGHMYMVPQWQP